MKHARADYDRIQDPADLIPHDEPVMLFRAQDDLFVEVCEFYARRHREVHGDRTAEVQRLTLKQAERGRNWPVKKTADI